MAKDARLSRKFPSPYQPVEKVGWLLLMWHRRPRLWPFLPSRGRLGHIFNGLSCCTEDAMKSLPPNWS